MKGSSAREQEGHQFRGEQDLGGRKSHKDTGLSPCKMAAFTHLSGGDGGGGPGQTAEGCPGSPRRPEIDARGGQRGGERPPNPLGPRVVPCLPAGLPVPNPAPAALDTDPCLQTQPGAERGGRSAGCRGGTGGRLAGTPPAVSSEELVRESGPGSWKELNALFLKLSIPSTPIVRASCKTSQAF